MEYAIERKVFLLPILRDIGFFSSGNGLVFDFGNCQLNVTPTHFLSEEIFHFSGIFRDDRRLAKIDFDLPIKIESYEQAIAFLAYHLESFDFTTKPEWLAQGIEQKERLPWRKKMRDYDENPKAIVEADWVRLIVKKLLKIAQSAAEDDLCSVSFDGAVLRFEVNSQVLVVSGSGKPWEESACLKAKSLDFLPKRLGEKEIKIFIWERVLYFNNRGIRLLEI